MSKLLKSTIIEGVATTGDKDVQGEILDIDGADITPLNGNAAFINSDHSGHFEHLVGRVIGAKKIKGLSDCETDSHHKYWNELKRPFIHITGELWNNAGHKEADAIASIYNHYHGKGERAPIKISVEGKTLERGKDGVLKRTLLKGIALTVQPANKSTMTDVVSLVKSSGASDDLIKSEQVPNFIEISEEASLKRIHQLIVTAKQILKSIKKN